MSKNINFVLNHWRKFLDNAKKIFPYVQDIPQRAFEMICQHNIFISTLGFLNQLEAVTNIQNPVTNVQAMQM